MAINNLAKFKRGLRVKNTVLVTRRDNVLVITLNRPEVHNAINVAMGESIADAMDELDSDDDLVVGVITGAGGTFCSGMDLKAFLRGERSDVPDRGFAGFTDRPPQKPIVAAVEGMALAGGFEIVLACDLIVAASNASFGLPEVKRGLIAGSGGLLRFPRSIPRHVATEYALTGGMLSAVAAHRWGMVSRLTEPGRALDEALVLAGQIAANAPLAVRVTKRLINEASTLSRVEQLARQHAALQEILKSDDVREGAQAFAERRAPRWGAALPVPSVSFRDTQLFPSIIADPQ